MYQAKSIKPLTRFYQIMFYSHNKLQLVKGKLETYEYAENVLKRLGYIRDNEKEVWAKPGRLHMTAKIFAGNGFPF